MRCTLQYIQELSTHLDLEVIRLVLLLGHGRERTGTNHGIISTFVFRIRKLLQQFKNFSTCSAEIYIIELQFVIQQGSL